jgi:hypothetical protein
LLCYLGTSTASTRRPLGVETWFRVRYSQFPGYAFGLAAPAKQLPVLLVRTFHAGTCQDFICEVPSRSRTTRIPQAHKGSLPSPLHQVHLRFAWLILPKLPQASAAEVPTVTRRAVPVLLRYAYARTSHAR